MHASLKEAMASRSMRLSHCLWHVLRDHWNRLSPTVQREYRQKYGDDWAPPRPSLYRSGAPILDNGAGRDFLWMHRLMIHHARVVTCRTGEPDILVWPDLPESDDPKFVPPTSGNFVTVQTHPVKSKEVWDKEIDDAARHFHPSVLEEISIGTLGTMIEYKIHPIMHDRYGTYSSAGTLRRRMDRPPRAGSVWEDVSYDSLFDHYSSHVNPWFWGIHTWIDAQITAWESANKKQVDWRGAWLGGWSRHAHHHPNPCDQSAGAAPGGGVSLLWEALDEDKLSDAIRSLSLPGDCGLYSALLTSEDIEEHLRSLGVPVPEAVPPAVTP